MQHTSIDECCHIHAKLNDGHGHFLDAEADLYDKFGATFENHDGKFHMKEHSVFGNGFKMPGNWSNSG